MSDDNTALREVLWNMYQEHSAQARHHEMQRASFGAALIAIAGVLIGVVTFDNAVLPSDLPLTFLVLVIGAFGAVFSAKHYERSRLHMERARRHRDALDRVLPGEPLKRVKLDADSTHNAEFPILHSLQLHKYWTGLYLVIAGLGLVLTFVAAFIRPQAL
jgi:hypothetical protein